MTEEEYAEPLTTFESGATTALVVRVTIMEEGRAALEKINRERGLGFDEFDLDYYTNLFKVRGFGVSSFCGMVHRSVAPKGCTGLSVLQCSSSELQNGIEPWRFDQ